MKKKFSIVTNKHYFENKECQFRNDGLGYLSVLEDSFLLEAIFDEFTVEELLSSQRVSPAFYILLNDDRLWMDAFFTHAKGNDKLITYFYNWKLSAIKYIYANGRDMATFPYKPLNFPAFQSMVIYTRWLRRHMQVADFRAPDSGLVDKRDYNTLTYEEFVECYEKPTIPIIFKGGQVDWPANTEWKRERLIERFGDTVFKISHNTHKNIPMRFRDYVDYMAVQNDEEPLYVFDQAFGEKAPEMLKEYSVPTKFFPEDLFQFQNEKRPHYRWIVIGPQRSGAPWHIDPAGTSAWNSLVSGCKRWLMYPPSATPIGVTMDDVDEKFYGGPASLLWLLEVYPYLPPDQKPIEVLQYPGETIFVPGGWWHMVLNLEESIAVTQNFCDSQNFLKVCDDLIGNKKNGKEYFDFKKLLLADKPEFESRFTDFELNNCQLKYDFSDLEHWTPLVKEVFSRHFPDQSLEKDDFVVTSSESGQSPVFFVNSKYVVKFFCTKYGGENSYLHECHLYKLIKNNQYLSSIFPELLGNGYLMNGVYQPPAKQQPKETTTKEENGEKAISPDTVQNDLDPMIWKWPYLITNFIEATSLQDVQDVPDELPFPYPPKEEDEEEEDDEDEDGEVQPTIDDKVLISLLAKVMMNIHNLPIEPSKDNPFIKDASEDHWSFWTGHLKNKLVAECKENLWNWGGLPVQLLKQADTYLASDLDEYIDKSLPPCYLHGDLTDENVMGDIVVKEKKPNPRLVRKHTKKANQQQQGDEDVWKANKLIDFGDANFGDRYYELVSLHLSIFAGNKDKLRVFLNTYEIVNSNGEKKSWLQIYNTNPAQFIQRCMRYTLIHHCNALTTIVRHLPECLSANSIDELARLIWDLDYQIDQ